MKGGCDAAAALPLIPLLHIMQAGRIYYNGPASASCAHRPLRCPLVPSTPCDLSQSRRLAPQAAHRAGCCCAGYEVMSHPS
ncbi:MAG: hypothetical protein J3K34DRAFT_449390 [Monoraphidium minutum]|nr:MAG: hypothetical protein J3K34DRAFT_449390 [Monoraphidium minutum]